MKNKTKIILVLFLLICIITQLSSCTWMVNRFLNGGNISDSIYSYTVRGINTYDIAISHYDVLDGDLLPERFLELYPYIDGDFYYFQYDKNDGHANAIIYMKYDEQTYAAAKAYALEKLNLAETPITEYCGFMVYQKGWEITQREHFMFCDEKQMLLSMTSVRTGWYTVDTFHEYVQKYFSFFNFETVKIERHLTPTDLENE